MLVNQCFREASVILFQLIMTAPRLPGPSCAFRLPLPRSSNTEGSELELDDVGGGIIQLFPLKGVGAAQVFSKQQGKDSETAKFLLALGEFMPFVLLRISCGLRWLMFSCWHNLP